MSTTKTPAECQAIDTRIAAAYRAYTTAAARLASVADTIQWAIGNKPNRRGVRPENLTTAEALARLAVRYPNGNRGLTADQLGKDLADRQAERDAAHAAYTTVSAEYEGWSRFFLVTSSVGHIHSSMSCHTCNLQTGYAWLPQLSGLTEADAVADQGSLLCTVCYPSAPVEYTDGSRLGREAQAAKDAKAAAKAARDAKAAAKAITAADGSPLRIVRFGRTETVATLAAAKSTATEMAEDLTDAYLLANRPELVAEADEALDVLAEALAAKLGTTPAAERAAAITRAARR